MKGRKVIISIMATVIGFMIAYSYSVTKEKAIPELNDANWDKEYQLRNKLIEQEEKTRKLQKELMEKQTAVTKIEKDLSQEAQIFFNLAEDAGKFRMFLGKVKVKGKGVEVTLADGEGGLNENINDYIVHEQHIFKVVNELYISGASAIAINGQRLTNNSYIVCNGPVITVDGQQYPAPFVISAIGEQDVLESSLNLNGGVKDQLVNENIVFSMERKDNLVFNPVLGN